MKFISKLDGFLIDGPARGILPLVGAAAALLHGKGHYELSIPLVTACGSAAFYIIFKDISRQYPKTPYQISLPFSRS